MKFNLSITSLFLLTAAVLTACGEDRSSEQPFAPTVLTLGAEADADSVVMTGAVTASPNSTLRTCGFAYGNDTLRLRTNVEEPSATFTATVDSLLPGDYYTVAFATNGVGTSYGDTLYFTIE